MSWTIYGLHHPTTDELRYVGMTTVGTDARYSAHCRDGRAKAPRRHLYKWWQRVVADTGLEPVIREIESGDGGAIEADGRERAWIALHLASGARLTNGTAGGQAWTEDQVRRRADAVRGRVVPDEQRARMSETIATLDSWGPPRRITDQEIADIRASVTGREGERAALVRATPWSITTVKRALDLELWTISTSVVGRPIALDLHDRSARAPRPHETPLAVVAEIRRRYDAGESGTEIAAALALPRSRVYKIAKREVYRHVA